jgi:hypothetical protein
MNEKMNEFDAQICEALERDEAAFQARLRDEPPMLEQVIAAFQGRQRWLAMLSAAATLVVMGLLALCAYQFFQAEQVRSMLAWSTGFLWCLGFIALSKIWFWGEMNKNSLLREVKRLEWEVARLRRRRES